MMNSGRLLLTLVLTTLMCACIPTRSTISNALVVKRIGAIPEKIFVLSYGGESLPEPFLNRYVDAIVGEFRARGSDVGSAQSTGLELDRDVYKKQIKTFRPQLVLNLQFSLHQVYRGLGDEYSGNVLLSLVDYENNQVVWRVTQSFQFTHNSKNAIARIGVKFAREAVQKLWQDHGMDAPQS